MAEGGGLAAATYIIHRVNAAPADVFEKGPAVSNGAHVTATHLHRGMPRSCRGIAEELQRSCRGIAEELPRNRRGVLSGS
eukprot:gene57698-biopygen13537